MSKKKSNTFVFESDFNGPENPFCSEFLGVKPYAWSRGDALEEKDKLQDFIRSLASGDIEFPVDEARALMDEMNWG